MKRRPSMFNATSIPGLVATAWLLAAGTAHAAIFTVGTPSGAGQPCTHGTIQSAINAANSSAGADTIRLTRSLTYQPEANTINTAQELTIEGGYAACTQATADTTNTVVSGTGGGAAPVFTIAAPTGALIRLRRLTISGGDVAGGGTGGGIRFEGDGILDIADSTITQNIAGYGGGIHAKGTGSNAELVIGANVVISSNTARYDGGGVLAQGIEMSMLGAGSSILLNNALGTGGTGGFGGGLFVHAVDRPSYAYIGSGVAIFGAITLNSALYGGGVAIVSQGSDDAELQLYTTDPTRQTRVGGNSASVLGGGIYVSSPRARARLWNAVLDDNMAPDGAAAYLASGAGLYVNFAGLPAAAAGCTVGTDCGRITRNVANTDSSPGAIVYGASGTTVQFGYLPSSAPAEPRGGVLIQNNQAGSMFGGAATTQIYRSVISNNTTSSDVIQQSTNPLTIADSTIAGNGIGGGSAILRTVNSAVTIQRSILWQPGRTSLSRSGGSITTQYVDASENASLGGPSAAYTFEPRFIDPEHGDYGLRAGSGAVDFAPSTVTGNERDAYGQSRNVDLPVKANNAGPRDIGALERQSLSPMVLNADFDFSDRRLWTRFGGEWDGTQNTSGGSGSGSWKYSASGLSTTRVVLGQQCIHLPGPGSYRLNGHGRTSSGTIATRDAAVLAWEFRTSGTETCNFGSPTTLGELTVGFGTSWSQAASPAVIDVAPADWTPTSSITVNLVGVDAGIVGPPNIGINVWFDGITLDVTSFDDVIFRNGFESN